MGLQFNVTYDASIPAAAKAVFNAVVQFFEANFTDNITVNVDVGWGELGLTGDRVDPGDIGENSTYFTPSSYTAIKNALTADAKTAEDATAVATLPASDPAPGANFWLTTAEAKALGTTPASSPVDGNIGFDSSTTFTYNTSNGQAATPGTYDLFGVAAHELSEVMGRSLLVLSNAFGDTDDLSPYDLFHFSGDGTRDFSGTTPGYFSVNDGATALLQFNTDPDGDFGDWNGSTNDAANAFGATSGTPQPFSAVDLEALDVIGWDRVIAGAGTEPVLQAIAAYNANPNLSPVSVADIAANVANGIDALQVLTARGKLASITLTDPPDPVVISAAQVSADAATLALIGGPVNLGVVANGALTYTLAANVAGLTVSDETSASIVGNASFNTVVLGSGSDTVQAGSGGSYIVGNGGNDVLIGGAGGGASGVGNSIYANGGNDFLQGGNGSPSDVLVATGAGNDTFYGGTGNNYIVGGTGKNTIVGGGGQLNSLYGNGSGGDYIVGGSSPTASNLLVEQGTGAAQLWGGPGNNYEVGGPGADLLVGGAGTNYQFGGAGDDTIYGGPGTNYIYPGPGNDFIWTDPAGVQSTSYIYEGLGTGVDTVADFTPGNGANHDVLVLTATSSEISSFADVQSKAFQAGVYTVLPISATDQVYLYNVQPFQLTANDFIFT